MAPHCQTHDMSSYIEECISEGKHGFLVTDIEGFLLACVRNATFARNEGLRLKFELVELKK